MSSPGTEDTDTFEDVHQTPEKTPLSEGGRGPSDRGAGAPVMQTPGALDKPIRTAEDVAAAINDVEMTSKSLLRGTVEGSDLFDGRAAIEDAGGRACVVRGPSDESEATTSSSQDEISLIDDDKQQKASPSGNVSSKSVRAARMGAHLQSTTKPAANQRSTRRAALQAESFIRDVTKKLLPAEESDGGTSCGSDASGEVSNPGAGASESAGSENEDENSEDYESMDDSEYGDDVVDETRARGPTKSAPKPTEVDHSDDEALQQILAGYEDSDDEKSEYSQEKEDNMSTSEAALKAARKLEQLFGTPHPDVLAKTGKANYEQIAKKHKVLRRKETSAGRVAEAARLVGDYYRDFPPNQKTNGREARLKTLYDAYYNRGTETSFPEERHGTAKKRGTPRVANGRDLVARVTNMAHFFSKSSILRKLPSGLHSLVTIQACKHLNLSEDGNAWQEAFSELCNLHEQLEEIKRDQQLATNKKLDEANCKDAANRAVIQALGEGRMKITKERGDKKKKPEKQRTNKNELVAQALANSSLQLGALIERLTSMASDDQTEPQRHSKSRKRPRESDDEASDKEPNAAEGYAGALLEQLAGRTAELEAKSAKMEATSLKMEATLGEMKQSVQSLQESSSEVLAVLKVLAGKAD